MVIRLQMTSQRLMTEVLIDTGVNSTMLQPPEHYCYTTPSLPCYVFLLIPLDCFRVSSPIAMSVLLFSVQTQEVSCPND